MYLIPGKEITSCHSRGAAGFPSEGRGGGFDHWHDPIQEAGPTLVFRCTCVRLVLWWCWQGPGVVLRHVATHVCLWYQGAGVACGIKVMLAGDAAPYLLAAPESLKVFWSWRIAKTKTTQHWTALIIFMISSIMVTVGKPVRLLKCLVVFSWSVGPSLPRTSPPR